MLISVTGMNKVRKELGFSLVEMMAVLLIISLMTGVVLLSRPQAQNPVEAQGKSMLRQFAQASEDSIVKGQPQAFGLYEDGFVFFEFLDGDWVGKGEQEWPDQMSVSFFKDDIEIDLPEDPIPLVLFEPTGLSTPFSLWLEGGNHTLIFSSEGDGRINLEREQ